MDQFQFFLTEQPSNRNFEEKESPSNRSVTKEFFDTLKVKEEDDEFLKNFFNKSKQGEFESKASNISNIIGNENESQFLLNNPNANVKEYGNIKISTFKEWARLSLLDFDKQKTYNESKLKPIKNCITQLKGHLRKSDYKFESKRKTISHSKESLKAMKLLLQNNVSTLLEVKEDLQKCIDLQPIDAKERIEYLKKKSNPNFLPLTLLKRSINPIEMDIFKTEADIYRKIIDSKVIINDADHFENMYQSIKNEL